MRFNIFVLSFILVCHSVVFSAEDISSRETLAMRALMDMVAQAEGIKKLTDEEVTRANSAVWRAMHSATGEDSRLRQSMRAMREQRMEFLAPTKSKPLNKSKALDRILLSMWLQDIKRMDPKEVKAHPSAATFPGEVQAAAPRISRRMIMVNTELPGWDNPGMYGNPGSPHWHSTGLYAAAGDVITVTVPEKAVGKGLHVRIGAHDDKLYRLDSWQRSPDICQRVSINTSTTLAASAFGGLVYIEVPLDLKIGSFKTEVSGAVAAPFYEMGKTDGKEWRDSIRNNPAPWGELASDRVIITLPSSSLRELDDPKPVLEFWDAVADGFADLSGRPKERHRRERYVPDVQISAGYMHSGYPLMTGLDMANVFIDIERTKKNGHGGVWGLFHEMGHNHQMPDWTFRGTTEVGVNIFSMYAFDQICKYPPLKAHGAISDRARARNIKKYIDGGRDFEMWKKEPFLALVMYIQLQQEFGWGPFKKVFSEYLTLEDAERPKSDNEKRDQWMVRFSRTIGKNLGPFFDAWGIPTTQEVRDSIKKLPEWMPEGFPPKEA